MIEVHYDGDHELAYVLRNAIEDETGMEVELVHESSLVEGSEILVVTHGLIDEVIL